MKSYQTTNYCKVGLCLSGMMLALPVFAQEDFDYNDEDIIMLSPFEVESSSNVGYQATQTLAGTRIKTDLKDVGSAISVVTKEMLRDTGATDNQTLLTYTTNTEVGGVQGNFAGTGDSDTFNEDASLLRPNANTRVRGLTSADNTRNFFLSEVPWDGYNTERVDMQRGPNAILFGMGSPAGIINNSTNQADFGGNFGSVEVKFDKEGSRRASMDYNYVVLEDELAVRIDALYDDTRYKQDPAYEKDKRIYGAVRYNPAFLQSENVSTTIKLNAEHGEIEANRPRSLPPVDLVTPWFTDLGQAGYDPVAMNAQPVDGNAGAAQETNNPNYDGGQLNPNYQPWVKGAYADAWSGPVWVYGYGSTTAESIYQFNQKNNFAVGSDGVVDGKTIGGLPFARDPQIVTYSNYAKNANLPGADYGIYKDKVLTDASFFDFYHNLIDGDNKKETQDFDTFNASFSQSFFDNRFSYEVVYDKQSYTEGTNSLLNSWYSAIAVDIRSHLSDGSVNEHFGQPYVFSRSASNSVQHDIERENYRFTVTAELRASDFFEEGSTVERILGKHNFTGLYSKERFHEDDRTWKRSSIANDSASSWGNYFGNNEITDGLNDTTTLVYIGDSMVGESMNGQNLSGLSNTIVANDGQVYYWDSTWNAGDTWGDYWFDEANYVPGDPDHTGASTQSENPANYLGWTSRAINVVNGTDENRDSLTTAASLVKNVVESKAFIWQAYLFDGLVVPTFGYREDTNTNWQYDGSAARNADQSINLDPSVYALPENYSNRISGSTQSWSIVVHSPDFINKHLPWGTKLSAFYNTSENFQPLAGRRDIYGDPVAPPEGDTEDYGFVITMFEDRVNFKVNWFETTVTNANVDGGFSAQWNLGAAEIRGAKYASYVLYGEGNGMDAWIWDWSQNMTDPRTGQAFASADAAREFGAYVSQLFLDGFPSTTPLGQHFLDGWNVSDTFLQDLTTATAINYNDAGDFTAPQNLSVTSDMKSEGVEFELFVQATDNWSISMNAAKVEATRYNLASTIEDWIVARNEFFNSDAGYVRLWGASNSGNMRDEWNQGVMASYNLFKLQENTSNSEVRPWRFNMITNYNFSEGFLKGFNVGGGVRWQDKNIIGYAATVDATTGGYIYDINSPYYGSSETAYDMWMGYQYQLTEKINWRIQFNIRNIFGKNELIPISVEPDGSWAAARIAEPMSWSITNTFSF